MPTRDDALEPTSQLASQPARPSHLASRLASQADLPFKGVQLVFNHFAEKTTVRESSTEPFARESWTPRKLSAKFLDLARAWRENLKTRAPLARPWRNLSARHMIFPLCFQCFCLNLGGRACVVYHLMCICGAYRCTTNTPHCTIMHHMHHKYITNAPQCITLHHSAPQMHHDAAWCSVAHLWYICGTRHCTTNAPQMHHGVPQHSTCATNAPQMHHKCTPLRSIIGSSFA